MRVLIYDRWKGGRDGPGVYVREFAKGLLGGGHQPLLAFDEERGPEEVDGLRTVCVPGLNARRRSRRALTQLEQLAKSFRPDLQIVECLDVPWLADSLAAHSPLVFSLHTHTLTCPNWTRVLWRSGKLCDRDLSPICGFQHYWGGCGSNGGLRTLVSNYRRALAARRRAGLFAAFHVPSDYMASTLLRAGIPAKRVVVSQYPAPLLREGQRHVDDARNPNRILFVGRLDREKGVQVLLAACRRLSEPYRLRLIGAADVDQNDRVVTDLLRVPELATNCEILPPTPRHADLSVHYASAAFVVVPSLWGDPSPLVRLEAMAHGRSVVGFAAGGVPSAIEHGRTGLLVPRGDTQALADAMGSLLREPEKARTMGRSARRYAETLSPLQQAVDFLAKVERSLFR